VNDSTEARLRIPYFPGLDGLRALAVLAVVVYHANHNWLGAGFLGVEVFFVISGYLITMLMIAERQRTGRVSLRDFWRRRAKRLLPALWTMLIGVTLYTSVFNHDEVGALRGDVVAGATYVSNWFQVITGTSYFSSSAFVPLRHLWSLAVEEQFYLVWPLVMFAVLAGRKYLPRVGLWLIGAAVSLSAFTAFFYKSGPLSTPNGDPNPAQYFSLFGRSVSRIDFLYLGSVSRFSGILLGAALAMFWQPWTIARSQARQAGRVFDLAGGFALVVLAISMWQFRLVVDGGPEGTHGYDLLFRGGFLLVGLATVIAIAAVTHPETVLGRTLVGNPLLVYLGQRSYGLYLYHWPVFQMYRKLAGKPLSLFEFVFLLLISLAITELSYRFIEMPLRRGEFGSTLERLRDTITHDRSARRVVLSASAVLCLVFAYSIASLATASVKVTGIEADIQQAENNITNVGPTTTAAGQTTTTVEGQTTTTQSTEAIDKLAIGDSVMAGAAKQLADYGFTVDAKVNRQFLGGVEITAYLGAIKRLGSVVVVHLGTNNGTDQETLDALVKPLQDVRLVVLLTIHVPERGWQDSTNELIRAMPAKYPNVKVLDWWKIAEEANGGLSSDGVHLGDAMKKVYADAINKFVALNLLAAGTTTTSASNTTTAG
jgi:peptidoglycan/LPS O-acetylase OafA/YrhL